MKRIQAVLEMKPLELKDMGPCGGFSAQYAAYCDLYALPFREEVCVFFPTRCHFEDVEITYIGTNEKI